MIFSEINTKDWEQLARYITGEMEPEEIEIFEERINSSSENRTFFNKIKKDWENMNNLKKDEVIFDADKAWGKLYNKIDQNGLIKNKKSAKVINLKLIMQIAAVFIVGITFSSLIYYFAFNSGQLNWKIADTYSNRGLKEIKLSDGSLVYLNADSKLFYPEKFAGKTRIVEFEGDAFFSIAKDPSKPFVIKVKKAQIKVLGTSFNVNTNNAPDQVEVLVETGKVQLSDINKANQSIFIEPGYIGKLNKNKLSKKPNSDVNYMSWKTRYFDFENGIKLKSAIEILNRAYHANIQCYDPTIADKELSSIFDNKSLETILQIICETYNLKQKKMDDGIILIP